VYRGADFEDCSYADFLTSAAAIGPALDAAAGQGVGALVLAAVRATRSVVSTNTYLGTVLLLAPLAAVPRGRRITEGVASVLAELTMDDARDAYEAIRLAQPGGLGAAGKADVNDPEPPRITLREAMALAAERDLVARQFVNGFVEVFRTAERIATAASQQPLNDAIVGAYLRLLAEEPDTLVARKCGAAVAREVSDRAAAVLNSIEVNDPDVEQYLSDFDFWLRSDGHRRNPGTSADVIAAALFVLLRDGRLNWPVKFY
jgi:triphosphoribosyl-dephospho-CoA synthase